MWKPRVEFPDEDAKKLGEEAYVRYVADYEERHPGTTLFAWQARPHDVQLRWGLALAPVASAFRRVRNLEDELRDLKRQLSDLRAEEERLAKRCGEVDQLRTELADAITLGQMTPESLATLTRLVGLQDREGGEGR